MYFWGTGGGYRTKSIVHTPQDAAPGVMGGRRQLGVKLPSARLFSGGPEVTTSTATRTRQAGDAGGCKPERSKEHERGGA